MVAANPAPDELAAKIYANFVTGTPASKAIGAQYLAQILIHAFERRRLSVADLRARLPAYLTNAIEFATSPSPAQAGGGK